jgi:hypothetical protein
MRWRASAVVEDFPVIPRRGNAATKKEIPRRGAKTAERQSDLYRLKTLCTTIRQKLVFLARFYLARSRCSLKPQSRQVRQTDSLRSLRLRVFARNNLVAALPRQVLSGFVRDKKP